jgi:Ca2+-binding EF-hand superfamily protein
MRLLPIVSSLLVIATVTVQAGQSTKSLTKRFDRLDLNGDDAVDAGEFAKLLPAKLTKNNALVQTRAAMFTWFDEDASAGIDLSEWLETMSGGNSSSPDFSDEVVDELDTNHDGNLRWKEFNRVIHFYVSSKTSRGWFRAISGASSAGSLMSVMGRAAFSVTTSSDTEGALSVAGPREVVTTTGGDCFAPAPSASEGLVSEE